MPQPTRIIFAGGGTGGHLFPAIAIADEVRKLEPDTEILFVGTRDKLEARVVPNRGYFFRAIWISGFRRSLRFSNLLFPLKVIVAMTQALSILKKFKPDVVVGTGGYVSGPVLGAALMLRVPTLIQEQNSYPGVTTRILAKKVNEVHATFESSLQYFARKDNVFITGNPTRADLDDVDSAQAYRYFGFNSFEKKKTVLVSGGSLGARSINNAVQNNLDRLMQHNIRLIWQTGENDIANAKKESEGYKDIWVGAFLDRMDYAYAVSDLVVCRAGATTIAELTRLGKPAILVPYPHAAANHQAENARALTSKGAAEVVDDKEISQRFLPAIVAAMDEHRLMQMSKQSKAIGKPAAARDIAQRVLALVKANNVRNN